MPLIVEMQNVSTFCCNRNKITYTSQTFLYCQLLLKLCIFQINGMQWIKKKVEMNNRDKTVGYLAFHYFSYMALRS